jgi:flagellar protein FlaF
MQDSLTPHTATNDAPANPREFEAAILIEGALRLQDVQSRWDSARHEVADALIYNRNLWSLLLASINDSAHPLPVGIRQSIANLGLFVTHQTMAIASDPRPEPLTSLIGINRELAAGLLGRA